MDDSLTDFVARRAGYVCEYCRIPRSLFPGIFVIEHIDAKQHGGQTVVSNLAFACLHCNLHKGPNIAGRDPKSGKLTPLYHPRRHKWQRHFRWLGARLTGKTAIGRTTVYVLAMNDPALLRLRLELIEEGLFAP